MRFLALLLCMALAACTALPPHSLPEDIASQTRLEVPFYPQQQYYCGPAALAEVANFRGVVTDQQSVAAMTFIPGRKGSLGIEMTAASRQLGLLPYPLDGGVSALLREVSAGNPVLVLQNLGFSWYPKWHYAVVVGYRLDSSTLILHSGEHAYYEMPITTFDKTWARADRWARVVVDSNTVPATAEPLTYIRTALAFDQTGHSDKAYDYYKTARQRWPEDSSVLMATANAALTQGDSRQARDLFERLLKQSPKTPALWNNYAYALQAQGCDMAAKMAITVAVQLAPEEAAFQESAADFPSPRGRDPQHCPHPNKSALY